MQIAFLSELEKWRFCLQGQGEKYESSQNKRESNDPLNFVFVRFDFLLRFFPLRPLLIHILVKKF